MSIYDLKTDTNELSNANQGTSRSVYEQVAPTRDITTTNFPNGAIHFRWQTSGQKWWMPSKSYIRFRFKLTKANGTSPLLLSDNIAPTMGLCASLFQSLEFRINDKVVSRIVDFVPQVDALETRLSKSASWLRGIGSSTNFWNADFQDRQGDVCADAFSTNMIASITERLVLGFDALTTIAIAATGVLTFATGVLPTVSPFIIGDSIEIDLGGAIGTVRYRVSAVPSATTLQLNNIANIVVAAVVAPFRRIRDATSSLFDYSRGMSQFEITWVPPLSIFKLDHALCCGRYELVLNPQTSSAYQLQAVESIGAGKIPGTDYAFSVQQMYLYLQTMEATRVDNLTYYLDLEQTNCQTEKLDNPNFQQKNFDISPSTYALTLAYQDIRAGSDTRYSPTKFVSFDAAGANGGIQDSLNRMFINYSGINQPAPDADPSYVVSSANGNTDLTAQRYLETQIQSGNYFDTGGAETIQEYKLRGSYYHFRWARDGSDRSTRVNVYQGFNASQPDIANTRVLLFAHSKQLARINIQDGRVIDVMLEDV